MVLAGCGGKRVKLANYLPHYLYIWIIISSKVWMRPIGSNNILVHSALHT